MVRVIPEPGHEDDRRVGRELLGRAKHLVAARQRHLDVRNDQVEAGVARLGAAQGFDRFIAVAAGGHLTSLLGEYLADTRAYEGIVVGDQDALAGHAGVGLAAMKLLLGTQDASGRGGASLDAFAEACDVLDNLLQAFAGLAVGEVGLPQGPGVVRDFGQRLIQLAEDVLGHLLVGCVALDDQQIEDVHRHGDIAAEDRCELPVVVVEGRRPLRLDVEHADDPVVQSQRHGQGAGRMVQAFAVQWILFDIGAQVALTGGRDVTGNPAALRLGVDHLADLFRRDAHRRDQFQAVGFLVEQADFEVIELQQIVHIVNDLLFQHLEPLSHVELDDRSSFDLHQFRAGGIDGVQLVKQAPAGRDFPHHPDHGRYGVCIGLLDGRR